MTQKEVEWTNNNSWLLGSYDFAKGEKKNQMTVSIQLYQKLSSTALGPTHTLKLNNSKFVRQRNQDNGPLE